MAEFLFEIGFEEMPAPWLSGLADQLRSRFASVAGEERLAPSDVRVFWTSRRLVLVAQLKSRQDDRMVVEWGPAAKIAKDASGNWSKAAEGFAKKQSVSLDVLTLSPKVEGSADLHVSARKHLLGRPTPEVLAGVLPTLLRGFNFPKRMNWDAWLDDGRGAFEFGRPIRWMVALFDGNVVPATIFDCVAGAKAGPRVASGRRSMGNRFYPRGASDRGFDVRSFAELEAGLNARFVILDPASRAERIRAQVVVAGGDPSGEAAPLLHEWSDLVEYPTVVVGTIPKEFADLPDEVLNTVLAHHQKAATLPRDQDGAPRFAAISGVDDAAVQNAARGQERVIVARLKDARFFYDEDRKRTLESRVDELAAITFQKGLGSYKDKVMRMESVARREAEVATLRPDAEAWTDAAEALRLSKADLVTQMVREFPELQGQMGGIYARRSKSPRIADAIALHYQASPTPTAGTAISLVSAATSCVDKLDTLVGHFRIGDAPTGSADPYALRRAGQGIVRTLLELDPGAVKLATVANRLNDAYSDQLGHPQSKPEVLTRIGEFLVDRLRHVLQSRGYDASVIDAVLAARERSSARSGRNTALENLPLVEHDIQELSRLYAEQREVFDGLAEAFKRAKNIVGDTPAGVVDPVSFVEDVERALFAAIIEAEGTPGSDPAARLRAVAALRAEVDAFFKGVMVNADDPRLKANRLALLSRLLNLVYEVADLSKLATPTGERPASS
ncbi:MAG: glycine--tRNA ligase subunit beta [Vicinamibacteria bacterium]|nr:glycine--tRNA ligase subunit beta [Vicinamibacteria bacterium]